MTFENLQMKIDQLNQEMIEAKRTEVALLKKELQKMWRDEDKRLAFLKAGHFYANHG